MGPKDVEAFDKLKEKGIKFDVRKVPNDNRGNMNEIMKKAKNELARA